MDDLGLYTHFRNLKKNVYALFEQTLFRIAARIATATLFQQSWVNTQRIHVWNIYLHWDYFKLL